MSTLANISGKEAVKASTRDGWVPRSQIGSHVLMTKSGVRSNLSVPQHKELATGTLRQLMRPAELTVDQFLSML